MCMTNGVGRLLLGSLTPWRPERRFGSCIRSHVFSQWWFLDWLVLSWSTSNTVGLQMIGLVWTSQLGDTAFSGTSLWLQLALKQSLRSWTSGLGRNVRKLSNSLSLALLELNAGVLKDTIDGKMSQIVWSGRWMWIVLGSTARFCWSESYLVPRQGTIANHSRQVALWHLEQVGFAEEANMDPEGCVQTTCTDCIGSTVNLWSAAVAAVHDALHGKPFIGSPVASIKMCQSQTFAADSIQSSGFKLQLVKATEMKSFLVCLIRFRSCQHPCQASGPYAVARPFPIASGFLTFCIIIFVQKHGTPHVCWLGQGFIRLVYARLSHPDMHNILCNHYVQKCVHGYIHAQIQTYDVTLHDATW